MRMCELKLWETSQEGKYLSGMPLMWVEQPSLVLGII